MNKIPDQERVALLKAVADCWPYQDRRSGHFSNRDGPYTNLGSETLYLRGNDIEDAPAMVLMLDTMLDNAVPCSLSSTSYCSPCAFQAIVYAGENFEETVVVGPTRAYAVAQCFVAIFGPGSPSKADPTDAPPIQNKSALSDKAGGKE